MSDTPRAYTMAELEAASDGCFHAFHDQDCPSCIRHRFWYEGRISGLREVATLLATNTALVDAMRLAVVEAERRDPPAFYNNRLIDIRTVHRTREGSADNADS